MPIIITWEKAAYRDKALYLGKTLQLPVATQAGLESTKTYQLHITEERIELVLVEGSKHHLYTEFLKGPMGYRRQKGGGKNQAIARAVGLKGKTSKDKQLNVLDATAGLGRDAFILATLGCNLQCIERSPIIALLLSDGLKRAEADPLLSKVVHSIKVVVDDAKQVLNALSPDEYPDIIYLDPMFPSHSKSALNKIEMRMVRDIVGDDTDIEAVFELALKKAHKRVVVKRPIHAPTLLELPPQFVVKGRSNRYDVYMTHAKK